MKKMIKIILLNFLLFSLSQAHSEAKYKLELLYNGKEVLWGFDFFSEDEILLTKRNGDLKSFVISTKQIKLVSKIPNVHASGQGGLLDLLIDGDKIFFTFSKKIGSDIRPVLATSTYRAGVLGPIEELFVAQTKGSDATHYGSRMLFKQEGEQKLLFLTIGDRGERALAQSLDQHHGKVLRLTLQGKPAPGNPFIGQEKALPEIYSFGHRNPQGITLDPVTGEIYSGEFGPRGGDEINIIRPGLNYGWPEVTKGREYWGPKIGVEGGVQGMEDPLFNFTPSLSFSGINFYNGDLLPAWKGNLFLACLKTTHLHRLVIENKKIIKSEKLFEELGERIRFVRGGPDGRLYFSTDSGKLYRVSPSA